MRAILSQEEIEALFQGMETLAYGLSPGPGRRPSSGEPGPLAAVTRANRTRRQWRTPWPGKRSAEGLREDY